MWYSNHFRRLSGYVDCLAFFFAFQVFDLMSPKTLTSRKIKKLGKFDGGAGIYRKDNIKHGIIPSVRCVPLLFREMA